MGQARHSLPYRCNSCKPGSTIDTTMKHRFTQIIRYTSYALDSTLHAICYHHVKNQRGSLVKQHCLFTLPLVSLVILPTKAASEIMSRQTMLFDKRSSLIFNMMITNRVQSVVYYIRDSGRRFDS
ncbi:hypothetical protein SFRURICE_014125 [Spodoptera frugiperda]|nr:hypothetical protein SFRURICE_014125 [Spodoptera frugiperda]